MTPQRPRTLRGFVVLSDDQLTGLWLLKTPKPRRDQDPQDRARRSGVQSGVAPGQFGEVVGQAAGHAGAGFEGALDGAGAVGEELEAQHVGDVDRQGAGLTLLDGDLFADGAVEEQRSDRKSVV